MELRLSKENYFVTNEGKFNLKDALKTAGLKAAVCFKPGEITPWDIRDLETEEVLIKRGINTITSDHVTPSQQIPVSLEMYDVPKIICMYLNNLGMQAADERSLRYTEVKPNEYLTETEVELYNKWMDILQNVLWLDYRGYFMKCNNNDEKKAKIAIKKLAQENARSFITVFMPTSYTITSNYAEFNKLALQIERTLNATNNTELEEMAKPYLKELLDKLKELNVVTLNSHIWGMNPSLAKELNVPLNSNYLYKDTKGIELNLFANKNKFSGIYLPDEFGASFHATRKISYAGFAQLQRHRTIRTELAEIPNFDEYFTPAFLDRDTLLKEQWVLDMIESKYAAKYIQGEKVLASVDGTLKDLITYVGSERGCNRAQYEISKFYLDLLDDYYSYMKDYNSNLANTMKPYVGQYRCRTKGYKCPTPCPGGPRPNRKF